MQLLLTGYSGFLGTALSKELYKKFILIRLGRQFDADIQIDLTNQFKLPKRIDHLIHGAGLAHLTERYNDLKDHFNLVNVNGTSNLLNAIDSTSLKSMIYISSVSVYGCKEGININEEYPLLANDPYGKSKIIAEELMMEYSLKNKIPLLILRLPLLFGPNPPGNLGAMIKAILNRRYFRINHGVAKKSILHIYDIAELCSSWLSNENKKTGIYNLTDGINPSLAEIENLIAHSLGKKIPFNLSDKILRIPAIIGDSIPGFPLNSKRLKQLTASLTFDDNKAKYELNWNPSPALSYPLIL